MLDEKGHNPRCAASKSRRCRCWCGGKFHGEEKKNDNQEKDNPQHDSTGQRPSQAPE